MKLEVGKYYKTRDGRQVGPMRNGHGVRGYDWDAGGVYGTCQFYSDIGKADDGHEFDLIAEWTDTPTIGTLAEIVAQVGDVVSCHNAAHNGTEFDITHGFEGWNGYDRPWWRIVSRASDYQPSESECVEAAVAKGIDYPTQQPGPVITETVKRIVPGVYGMLDIVENVGPYVRLNFTGDSMLSRAELIAARDILSELIDAMPSE